MILGIDYGRVKIGLSLGEGLFASPYKVLKVSSWDETIKKLEDEINQEKIEKVVVGISEGDMSKEQLEFVSAFSKVINIPVITWDEGLSTQDAQLMAREAGMSRVKLKRLEDAFAATIMLQSWIDSNISL